jgi:deoxyribonuclease (pyrimidine dimer)
MTRINCIPPRELSREHLIAEYRELPRIFALVRAAIARGESPDDPRNPTSYTLGAGHVRFFYCRLGYLVKRQLAIIDEMRTRGYRTAFGDPAALLAGLPAAWCQDWDPTPEAVAVNLARIEARRAAMGGEASKRT